MKRFYLSSHEWVLVDSSIHSVGISDHAQHALGDIVFVVLPAVGDVVTQGERFGDVESVKAVSELISPLSGKVVEVNEALLNAPETLNQDPLGTWIIKVEGSVNEAALIDEATYLAMDKD
jgi:glycine cleavage system H protein